MLWSWCHHSSDISIVSRALASPWASWRCFCAWVISCWRYSPWKVLRILKKYSRSGTLPLGIFVGKNCMNSSSFLIMGHNLITDNSSYKGTHILLTSWSLRSRFLLMKTSLRKSLFNMWSGGRYSCTEQNRTKQNKTDESSNGTYNLRWSTWWSLILQRSDQTTRWASFFSSWCLWERNRLL